LCEWVGGWERERARECVAVWLWVCAKESVCTCALAYILVHTCVFVCCARVRVRVSGCVALCEREHVRESDSVWVGVCGCVRKREKQRESMHVCPDMYALSFTKGEGGGL